MKLNHVALAVSSAENAKLFYEDILGLEKIKEFVVSKEMSSIIFHREQEFKIVVYGNEEIKYELFVIDDLSIDDDTILHSCLEAKDRQLLINKCREYELPVITIPKGDSYYLFIRDPDGNLFEVKELIA